MTPRAHDTCANCPLGSGQGVLKQVTTEVRGQGIDILFITDYPGDQENEIGRPVVGKSGQILRRLVLDLFKSDYNVAYANAVRCRPCVKDDPGHERKPTPAEIAACRPNLLADIDLIKPKQIVICGDVAAKGIARRRNGDPIDPRSPITAIRGQDFTVTTETGLVIPAVVTYSCGFVQRTPEVAQVFRDDVIKAFLRAQNKIPDYAPRGKVTILDTIPKLRKFQAKLETLTQDDIVVIDYETDSNTRINNPILCIGFAYGPDRGFVIPFRHAEAPWTAEEFEEVKTITAEILGNEKPAYGALVAHNFDFEQHITRDTFGFRLKMPMEDTLLRAHAINPDRSKAAKEKDDDDANKAKGKKTAEDGPFTLKTLVKEWLGFYHYDDPDIAPIVALRNQGLLGQAPFKGLADYNGMDCYTTYRLYRFEDARAAIDGYKPLLSRLGRIMHTAVTTVLVEMERNGMRVDKEYLIDLIDNDSKIFARLRAIEQQFYGMETVQEANRLLVQSKFSGGGLWGEKRKSWLFDINSPEGKQILYFDVLQLQPVAVSRKTKVPSVGKALFEEYVGVPEIDLFAEWSVLAKLKGTYLLGDKGVYTCLKSDPDNRDGRVRPHYRAGGTITGRISASKPNVLNVPKKGEDGKKNESASLIKKLYICDPGHLMVTADYSQAEVRWLAEITQDPDLLAAFQLVWDIRAECFKNPTKENIARLSAEGDFHKHTASMIFGVPIDKVDKNQRQAAKAVMFGLVYGMSIDGLALRLKVSKAKAEEFIEKFFARFLVAKAALDRMEVQGFTRGYIESPTGRRKSTSSRLIMGPDAAENIQFEYGRLKSFFNHEARVSRNMPIQGIASDMNLLACYTILKYKEKHGLDWRLINTVYDSIMLEVPFAQARHCLVTVQKIMESPKLFSPFGFVPKVRFFADTSAGISWADQLDITSGKEVWKVKCLECGKAREESSKPKDHRCWECGSKKVKRDLDGGPIDLVLSTLDAKYHVSEQVAS